ARHTSFLVPCTTLFRSGVALLSTAHGVHCVWSDARNAPRAGSANLFSALLSAATAERVGVERQLIKAEEHSHSPQLLELENGERSEEHTSELQSRENIV